MFTHPPSYYFATRHPWCCLLFLLPLLLCYEAGVLWLGGARPETLRNGADNWLRSGLEACGLHETYAAPALVVVVFAAWSWQRRWDRPPGTATVWLGMALESVLFGIGLWALSQGLRPLLDELGIQLSAIGKNGDWLGRTPCLYPFFPNTLSIGPDDPRLTRIVTFVGAGIYEEVLFRLLLFFLLGCFLGVLGVHGLVAAPLVAVTSALIFSGAHHVGPYGEAYDGFVFLFRALAGLYFAVLYQLRGFGIAVGTHAFYDVLVGVLMTQK